MAWTRRQFLFRLPCIGAGLAALDGFAVEPDWIEITRHDFSHLGVGKTIVHLTDTHYRRSDRGWLEGVLRTALDQKPDLICFTGDLVDGKNRKILREALEVMATLPVPLYGVIGNHDPDDAGTRALFRQAAKATGGMWLFNERLDLGKIVIEGTTGYFGLQPRHAKPRILLCHYPIVGDRPSGRPYELILSGHSHGGQCRLPGVAALYLPQGVGRYVAGHYDSPAGRLFVSRGIGTTGLPVRFACRPEMAVFRI
ncbi:metallophosphoesterase [Luteolibacter ambystomatis]|uniref:Metallophosphoesterase n=1 Tax=Luteolibacter ambystomatis TaxID=2824561 RepID=A0A975G7X2_9BACT|nr:metallophosphoesterase [Luteolibacter ambystomatis]QUE50724.1 metallophosphoesterase [Luteolibacter ambystomatis]